MAYLNVKDRVIEAKLVYYGAGLSGKTTNLEQVKSLSRDGRCGDMITLDTDGDRTLFFDWLPFNIGKFNGCDVKLQLFTVPGQARYAETRRKVLASADGVVLVLDSQSGALQKNREILADLRDHMTSNELKWGELPVVVQLNKRDLPTAMVPTELMAAVGVSELTFVEAVAAKGEGVFETLREATRLILTSVREAARQRAPELRTGESSGLDGNTLYAKLTEDAPPAAALPATPRDSAASLPAPDRPPAVLSAQPHAHPNGVSAIAKNGVAQPEPVRPSRTPPETRTSSPAGSAQPPATQIGEVIAGQRNLARRLDAIEASLSQSVAAAVASLEKRLLARLTPAEDKSATLALAIQHHVDQLTGQLTQLHERTDGRVSELVSTVDSTVGSTTAMLERSEERLVLAVTRAAEEVKARTVGELTTWLGERLASTDAASKETREAVSAATQHLASTVEQSLLDRLESADKAGDEAHAATRAAVAAASARSTKALDDVITARVERRLASVEAAATAWGDRLDALYETIAEGHAGGERRHVDLKAAVERAAANVTAVIEPAHARTESALETLASATEHALLSLGERLSERSSETERSLVNSLRALDVHVQAGLSSQAQKSDLDALRGALLKSLMDLRVSLPTHQQLTSLEQAAERRHADVLSHQVTPSLLEQAIQSSAASVGREVRERTALLDDGLRKSRDAAVAAHAEVRQALDSVTTGELWRAERIQDSLEKTAATSEAGFQDLNASFRALTAALHPAQELWNLTLKSVQETRAAVTENAGVSETWRKAEQRFGSLDAQVHDLLESIRSVVTELQTNKKSWWK